MKKHHQRLALLKGLMLISKISIASGLSWELAKIMGSKHPYLAPLTVILSIQETVQHSALYAIYRIIGTLFGIGIIIFIMDHLKINGWTISLLLAGGMVIPVILRVHKTIIHQVALTILLVFVFSHKTHYYVSDRIRDTIIGALVAIVIHMFIHPPNYVKESRETLGQFGFHLGQLFKKTGSWVNNNCLFTEEKYLREEITHLLEELHQAQKNLKKAKKSLKLNLYGQDKQKIVRQHEEVLSQLKQGYLYLSSILTTFSEWSKSSSIPVVSQQQWAIQLHTLGSYITELANNDASYKLSLDLSLISSRNHIPQKLEPYQYQISLYNDTLKLMNKLGNKEK